METITKSTENLSDLIQINNDRIAGYELAIKELKPEDHDLKILFLAMIDESVKIKSDIVNELQMQGGGSEQGTTTRGKIYGNDGKGSHKSKQRFNDAGQITKYFATVKCGKR